MARGQIRSFSDPDTHFEIVVSHTPVSVDGVPKGVPTGVIRCTECGAEHEVVEDIPHDPDCPQRDVLSEWWVEGVLGTDLA